MDWFANNPNQNASFLQRSMWKSHIWGRQQFAKSYARGGMAATVFAPSRKEMLISPWRRRSPEGSNKYISRLRRLQSLHQQDPGIKKALSAVEKGAPRSMMRGGFGGLGGMALGGALVLMPGMMEDGPIEERARAVTSGLGGFGGWAVGAKAGMGIGAAIGSLIPTGIGTAIGAGIGYIAGGLVGAASGEAVTDALTRIPDRIVATERSRRGLNWGQNTAAFQTKRAHTMRQQSLALMNKGAMSSRSLMGQEAVFVHR